MANDNARPISIRLIKLKDVLPLRRLHLSLDENERFYYNPFSFNFIRITFTLLAVALTSEILRMTRIVCPKVAFLAVVALEESTRQYAGFNFLLLQRNAMGYKGELGIIVVRGFRELGVASQLMEEIVILARKAGINTIKLGVMEDNIAAKRLYAKFGFETIGREKVKTKGKYYYKSNMKLELGEP